MKLASIAEVQPGFAISDSKDFPHSLQKIYVKFVFNSWPFVFASSIFLCIKASILSWCSSRISCGINLRSALILVIRATTVCVRHLSLLQAHWAVTPKPYLILILQTPNRYHIHTVLTSVSISTCSRQHHHKRWSLHPRGIYLFCQRFQVCCTFLNQPLST